MLVFRNALWKGALSLKDSPMKAPLKIFSFLIISLSTRSPPTGILSEVSALLAGIQGSSQAFKAVVSPKGVGGDAGRNIRYSTGPGPPPRHISKFLV